MSTWQLFSDSSGDGFRWEVSGRILQSDSDSTPTKALESTALPSMTDLLLQGYSRLIEHEESITGNVPMFITGLGKSVSLKESSIARAKSILGDDKVAYSDLPNTRCSNPQTKEVDTAGTLPMFRIALGSSVLLKESSITKALSVLGGDKMIDSDNVLPREGWLGVSNTLFQTASNRKVNVSSASMARPQALLDLEADDLNDFNHVNHSSSYHQQHGWSGLKPHEEVGNIAVQHQSGIPGKYEDHGKRSEIFNPSFKLPPTMFQTAGGKSLSVSAEALKRARNLLRDPELGIFFDDIMADDQFITPPKDDIGINDGSDNRGYIAYEENTSKIHTSNNYVSPLRSSSKKFRSVKLRNLHSGGNLIKKFDAAVDQTDCTLNITKLAARGLSNNSPLASDRIVDNSKENGCLPRAKQLGRTADQPLVDITNCSDIAFANNKQDCTQKKRLGNRVTVAPFKKPRISSIKTSLKKDGQQAASGKEVGVPLAFNCIKCNGGPLPETLAGITRIYPIFYRERLGERTSIVRSERMESRVIQLHSQRRSALVEGLMSEYQRGINGIHSQGDTDCEGAKVFKLLETTAEPNFLVADMTMEQLKSYSTYKAKFEAAMQKQMGKSVTKALEDAGLGERNVTPFMRIRLVGLTSLSYEGEHKAKEGIVTIWDPTEKQMTELTEGKIYVIEGLVPVDTDSETLYLHDRASSSKWQPLSAEASASFQPFFNPRKPISLSNIGEIPFSSEFDIAAYVVHVGDAYTDGQHKKQWVFVTDGSAQVSHSGKLAHSLLAISFCTPSINICVPIICHKLVGSIVGFCNVIKRAKDVKNEMWVGEATENTDYLINTEAAYPSHLKSSSAHIQTWAKLSSSNSVIYELRQRVLSIIA